MANEKNYTLVAEIIIGTQRYKQVVFDTTDGRVEFRDSNETPIMVFETNCMVSLIQEDRRVLLGKIGLGEVIYLFFPEDKTQTHLNLYIDSSNPRSIVKLQQQIFKAYMLQKWVNEFN